ncbi:MAG: hypothetical protein Q8L44_08735 [Sulfuritalea sp.]|nr:hypothetical protein [Sulfuritalea sp.]
MATQVATKPAGFKIKCEKDFGRTIAGGIKRLLNVSHARAIQLNIPSGQSLRIASAETFTRDQEGLFPVLCLREPQAADGAWLEIAVDYLWDKGSCFITHISLKLFIGASPRSSTLRFRAEWDPRGQASAHAQPHWNIDMMVEGPATDAISSEGVPWAPVIIPAPWATTPAEDEGIPTSGISHFHFAMSATWQNPTSSHSASITDEAALARWISGCAAYIRDQLNDRRIF